MLHISPVAPVQLLILGIKMPGNLYFYRGNDIIHLFKVGLYRIAGMVRFRPGVGSTGAVLNNA